MIRTAPAPGLDSPITALPKIRPAEVRALHRLGLETVRDLLLDLPYEWDEYGGPTRVADLTPGATATLLVTVAGARAKKTRFKGKMLTEADVRDHEGGTLKVVWFNQPYLAKRLHPGDRLAVAGQVTATGYGRGIEMRNPHFEHIEEEDGGPRHVGGLMPKYHLSGELKSPRVAALVEAVLPLAAGL